MAALSSRTLASKLAYRVLARRYCSVARPSTGQTNIFIAVAVAAEVGNARFAGGEGEGSVGQLQPRL